MMVKLIHAVTGGEMWVHEDRLAEYLAAGHKPAEDVSKSDTSSGKTRSPKKSTKKPKE